MHLPENAQVSESAFDAAPVEEHEEAEEEYEVMYEEELDEESNFDDFWE